jgi:hypothetical protein
MKRLAIALLVLLGCRKETPTVAVTDSAVTAPAIEAGHAAPDAEPQDAGPKTIRIKGPLEGGFAVDRLHFVAGAPIIVTFAVTNTAKTPLTFDIGGDASDSLLPLRYGLVVRDAKGTELCNLQKSQPTGKGGVASSRILVGGGRFRDRIAINGACEALLSPGKYSLTLVRRLDALGTQDAGACDPMMPSETVPPSASPACRAALEAAPLVASDIEFEVVPYDPKAIQSTLEPMVTEAKVSKDLGEHSERVAYFEWLCRRVTCSCKPLKTAADLAPFMSASVAKLPATIPSKCP